MKKRDFLSVKTKIVFTVVTGIFLSSIFWGCSKNSDSGDGGLPTIEATTPSQEVMMQAFYWDVTPGGVWWDTLNSKLSSWQSAGITSLWLPVVSKAQNGPFSMGYDLYDYFDFGQYNQSGSIETRFGSKAELTSLMSNATDKGFKLIADIIINHNSGGSIEANPYTGGNTYTKFTPKSDKFNRSYEDFHPSAIDASDEGSFGQFPDLCHNVEYVKDWLWRKPESVAKYYRDSLGFDGWRFDYVKGFSPNVVKDWLAEVGGFSIGEYYDGNVNLVNDWCNASNSGAFDFPLMFAMDAAFDGNNIRALEGAGLISVNPSRAYTFVANHDVDDISTENKLRAYAYIMCAEGTPFVFYKDYEFLLDKTQMNMLINIRKTLAAGSATKLYSGFSEYIFRRNGTPGLVAYFNNGTTDKQKKIQTTWANKVLKDYTGVNADVSTDGNGYATILCKGNSYSIYSPK